MTTATAMLRTTTATLAFNGRGATAASGVTAMVGDDDIISIGGSNSEMALFASFSPTTSSLGEASKIWEVARMSPEVARTSPGSPVSIVTGLVVGYQTKTKLGMLKSTCSGS